MVHAQQPPAGRPNLKKRNRSSMGYAQSSCKDSKFTLKYSKFWHCLVLLALLAICGNIRYVARGGFRQGSDTVAHSVALVHEVQSQPLTDIRVFVGALSGARNVAGRQAVRETWGADKRLSRVMFSVLRPSSNTTFVKLRQEAAKYGDIIVTSEVMDNYTHITHATLAIFKVAVALGDTITHVFKTDDDCYLRVPKLLDELGRLPRERLYAGFPWWHTWVERKPGVGGWYIPYSDWPSDESVWFGFGMGYALSLDLVRHIAAGAPHMIMAPNHLLQVEDWSTGFWVDYIAKEQNLTINHGGYVWDRVPLHICQDHTVVTHTVQSPDLLRCMHAEEGKCCLWGGI